MQLGVDKYIYDEYILRQSWNVISARGSLILPTDYRPLIEAVYDEFGPEQNSTLVTSWKKLKEEQNKEKEQARQRILPEPSPYDAFSEQASMDKNMFKESETDTHWNIARTRLGEESLTVIPLERSGNTASFEVDGKLCEVDLSTEIDREMQLRLLRKSVHVSNRRAVEALKEYAKTETPKGWDITLLKDCIPLWLESGKSNVILGKHAIRFSLDPQIGLAIFVSSGG